MKKKINHHLHYRFCIFVQVLYIYANLAVVVLVSVIGMSSLFTALFSTEKRIANLKFNIKCDDRRALVVTR